MITPVDLSSIQLADLSACKGWQPRYKLLLNWSKLLTEQPELRQPQYAVNGCESNTWLCAIEHEGSRHFVIDSESRVVKGLGVLLLLLINNHSDEEILSDRIEETFRELGLQKHLSPSRSNGFKAMLEQARSSL